LWFLDGALQLQHQMFTANFANEVITPAAQGQPSFVSGPMHLFVHIFLIQPALFNTFIAITQLGIGLLILYRRTAKLGLWSSIIWGLFVWYIGEGLGGLASGHTLLLMGAPGAVLIYVLLAIGTLPRHSHLGQSSDHRPAYWLVIVWVELWAMGSVYQLLPGQNTVADVSAMVSTNASSAPHWMASLDNGVVHMLHGVGTATASMGGMSMTPAQMAAMSTHQVTGLWFLLLLSVVQIAIGFAVIIPGFIRRFAVVLGCVFALIFWVIGQSMGNYFSGLATDPNSGPLFILLGIAVLGCTQRDERVHRFFGKIKSNLTAEFRAFNEG
jgi:hypothetical protein